MPQTCVGGYFGRWIELYDDDDDGGADDEDDDDGGEGDGCGHGDA